MIKTNQLKHRDLYLEKLIAFQDTEPVKVITGIRRCGKSSLLKLMVQHLLGTGIDPRQILEINFESLRFGGMTSRDFYDFVAARVIQGKRLYLFLDEVQRIPGWEDAVNSFRVDFDCDIYLTGSNAYLLSSEYSTYLAGRYVEIKMLPLSFREFLDFHGFSLERRGDRTKHIVDPEGREWGTRELFNDYMRLGGMPGITDAALNQEKALVLLEGICSTVFVRDILDRENLRGRKKITDPILLRKILLFLSDNIGSNVSVSSIGKTLIQEGLMRHDDRKGPPSAHTVQSYVDSLLEAYFFYEIKRFDIKGKDYLRTLGKYYITDIGLRNYLLGFRNRDGGHVLENIVYLELLRRGYDLAIGKIGDKEIDFIATKANEKRYLQVTESMASEEVRERELEALRKIDDNYPKLVLSLDTGLDSSYEGIESKNLVDWLLED